MKKIIHLLLFVFFTAQVSSQNFNGQWRGEFIDKSTSFTGWGGDRCEYVLEIECKGTKVSGYSYTYFSDGGKRYYTICKLSGTLNKASKYLEVKEIERTKTNVPVNIRNCFQIHRLTYLKQDDQQTLQGTWIPVPDQAGDCGFGTTLLSRKILKKNPLYYDKPITKTNPKKPAQGANSKIIQKTPPVVKVEPKQNSRPPLVKPDAKKITESPIVKSDAEKKSNPEIQPPDIATNNLPKPQAVTTETIEKKITDPKFEKRNNDLIKTIEIDNASITVDLYDNGEIDGDSISLFFNGKLLLSHKRLSDKAIRLKLNIDESKEVNELIMYAENLGTIPPNTALMVVNDGDNRYEVRISSDLQKSGVIRFVHKAKKGQ